MTTQPTRSALISRHLGVSRPFSEEASDLSDRFREILSDAESIDPVEEMRLLAALQQQISGRIARLAGV